MARIALGIEYDGTAYRGWQQQAHARSVQDVLERALAVVADHRVHLTAAGRTDAGVHALMQVAHFDTSAARPMQAWVLGGSAEAPDDVSVLWAHEVPVEFHARFSANARTYLYRILNRRVRPALERERSAWVRRPLDADAMHAAAQALLGEHDFSAFRAAECQSSTPVRRVTNLAVRRAGDHVEIKIRANAFLHHMVRNVAGSLIAVGVGDQPPQWVREVLDGRDRTRAGATAAPQGLYFAGVEYDASFGLPSAPSAFG
jgi:tRNA pseudouridine38-40 synthase